MIKKVITGAGIICCLYSGTAGAQDVLSTDTIGYYRSQIDSLDKQLVNLLGQRMQAARAIGLYKMDHKMGVVQSARFEEVLHAAIGRGKQQQLSEAFVRAFYNDIHKESIRQQELLQAKRKAPVK